MLQFGTGHRLSKIVPRLRCFNMARELEGPLSSASSHHDLDLAALGAGSNSILNMLQRMGRNGLC